MNSGESFDDSATGRQRRWMIRCQGKEPFDSRALANTVNLRRGKKGQKGNVYKCVSCQKYHIGSPQWAKGGRK